MIIEEQTIDADFRNDTVTALLNECDIVITNPPFSLFRDFLAWINPDEKKFLILGNIGAVGYKEVFPFIRDNKLWLGIVGGAKEYIQPDGTLKKMGNTCWFTNIVHNHRTTPMVLLPKSVHEANGVVYQQYYNYDAIDIPAVKLIPKDYTGEMGVPVSFLDRYNPEQFEIVGLADGEPGKQLGFSANISEEEWSTLFSSNKKLRKGAPILINDQGKPEKHYARLIIRNKFNS